MSIRKIPILIWLPSIAWGLLILAMTLPPAMGQALPRIPHLDKLVHFAAFFMQAVFLFFSASRTPGWLSRHAFGFAFTVTSTFGALDEFLQYFIPGRSCEAWDLIADMTGAALAVLLSRRFQAR